MGMDDDMPVPVPTDVGTDDAITPAVPTDDTTSLPDDVGDDVNAPPTPPVAIGGFVTSTVDGYVGVDVDPATMPPPSLADIVGIAVIPPTPPVATDGVGATLSYARYVGISLSAAVWGAGTTLGSGTSHGPPLPSSHPPSSGYIGFMSTSVDDSPSRHSVPRMPLFDLTSLVSQFFDRSNFR